MAKQTPVVFSVDAANTRICTVNRPSSAEEYFATVLISGTFGSGTVTMFISPDGGTTKVALKDIGNTAISATAAAMFNIRLGNGATNSDAPILYATLAGSTNPTITVAVFDNL